MAHQKGKVTTKPPREPPPSKLKTRQRDLVDPSHIVKGHRSRTPSSRLLQSSDAKRVSKPVTGSETAGTIAAVTTSRAPAPAPDIQEPGPVTTVTLSMILEEQESLIKTNQEIDADDEDLYMDHPSMSSDKDIFSGLEPLDIELPSPSDQTSKAIVVRKVGKGASKAAVALPHTIKFSIPSHFGLKQVIWCTHHVEPTTTIADLKETIHLILGLDAIPAVKRPPLVMHIKHNPAKLCFTPNTDNHWEALKDKWRKRAAKQGEVTGPKFFDFLEEAVVALKERPSLLLTPFFRMMQPLSLMFARLRPPPRPLLLYVTSVRPSLHFAERPFAARIIRQQAHHQMTIDIPIRHDGSSGAFAGRPTHRSSGINPVDEEPVQGSVYAGPKT
ncbi:hypothetical protein JB92DRAFT_3112661 [Gautieria morchelliformis]|nr:hypothetical protein JB92DRAFT_3112661 [Gautieria morchelliformis]